VQRGQINFLRKNKRRTDNIFLDILDLARNANDDSLQEDGDGIEERQLKGDSRGLNVI
jgi:hypothetical protein